MHVLPRAEVFQSVTPESVAAGSFHRHLLHPLADPADVVEEVEVPHFDGVAVPALGASTVEKQGTITGRREPGGAGEGGRKEPAGQKNNKD